MPDVADDSAAMDRLLAVVGRSEVPALDALEPGEWNELLEAACHHRVAPLLWHRLQERGVAHAVPAGPRRRMVELHALGALHAEGRRLQLVETVEALAARGIAVVLLKGAFLAPYAYAAAALRPMGDIDLLVPEGALEASIDALVELGYTPPDEAAREAYLDHRHPPPLRRRGSLTVELHTTIEPCAPPFRLPLGDVWERARAVSAAGPQPLALSPEDLLLHLATHMGRSHLLGSSLVSLCDIAVWLCRWGGSADWDAVVRRAIDSDARRFVYAALELSRVALSASAPEEVRRLLRGGSDDHAVTRAMELLRRSRAFPADPVALLDLRASWTGMRRLAGMLAPDAVRRWRRTPGARTAPSPYPLSTRWAAVGRLLVRPSARRAVRRQSADADWLRRWALADG